MYDTHATSSDLQNWRMHFRKHKIKSYVFVVIANHTWVSPAWESLMVKISYLSSPIVNMNEWFLAPCVDANRNIRIMNQLTQTLRLPPKLCCCCRNGDDSALSYHDEDRTAVTSYVCLFVSFVLWRNNHCGNKGRDNDSHKNWPQSPDGKTWQMINEWRWSSLWLRLATILLLRWNVSDGVRYKQTRKRFYIIHAGPLTTNE